MHPTTQLAVAAATRDDTLRRVDAARTRHQLVAARRNARAASLSAAARATLARRTPTAAPVCCAA